MTAKKPKAVKAWAVVHDNKISVWTIRGADAKMLHDATDTIDSLRARVAELEGQLIAARESALYAINMRISSVDYQRAETAEASLAAMRDVVKAAESLKFEVITIGASTSAIIVSKGSLDTLLKTVAALTAHKGAQ